MPPKPVNLAALASLSRGVSGTALSDLLDELRHKTLRDLVQVKDSAEIYRMQGRCQAFDDIAKRIAAAASTLDTGS